MPRPDPSRYGDGVILRLMLGCVAVFAFQLMRAL